MAQQLTIELSEWEMDQVQAASRARRLDPAHMTAQQLIQALDDSQASTSTASAVDEPVTSVLAETENSDPMILAEEARAKRKAAIMRMHGIWKDDPTKPKDPVAYQREVRAEWQ